MYNLLIQDIDILQIDGAAAHILPGHDLAIQGGTIAAIAPTISPTLAHQTLAAPGRLAIPGLINAHAHAAMGLFRGVVEDVPIEEWFNGHIWPMELNLTADDVYWGALLGFTEMIEAGVTAVADHYFAMNAIASAVQQAGLRAQLAWTVFSGPDEEAQLAQSAAFVAEWHGAANGRISAWLGPHSPYTCTPAFLARVAERARQLNVGVHIHLSETADQVRQSRAAHGKTPVAVAYDAGLFQVPAIAAHLAHPEDDDQALLAANGVSVAVCPKTEMKLGIGVAPVADLLQAGITVALGSDGAASNNSYNILEAARLTALLEKHRRQDARILPIGQALALATRDGARALGLAGVTGELRVGLAADLVLLNFEGAHVRPVHDAAAALLYSSCTNDVETVIVDGRILMHERRLLTVDKAAVLREVAARIERITQPRNGAVAVYPEAK
jgi:5-methylthioadenosine/S-adenosylhomocysteine deaminase